MKHLLLLALIMGVSLHSALSQTPKSLRLIADTERGHLGEAVSGDAFLETQRRLLMLVLFDKADAGKPMDVRVLAVQTSASMPRQLVGGPTKIDAEGRVPLTLTLPSNWPVGEYAVRLETVDKQVTTLPFRVRPTSPRTTPLKVGEITFDRVLGPGKSEPVPRFTPADRHWNFSARVEGARTEGVPVRWLLTAVQTTSGSAQVQKVEIPRRYIDGSLLQFDVSLPRDWPAGRYKVELFIDNTLEAVREFDVQS